MTVLSPMVCSVQVPGRTQAGLIDRRDLVAALDLASRKRVTIVSAPAGGGKTSLVRAWAEGPGRDRRVAYVAVPGPSGCAAVRKALSELTEPAVLVIDDVHELGSPEAVEQLGALLRSLPPGVHAIVLTRRDTPLGLHRLRLAGELAELRAAQLRFTEDETRELLAAAGIELSEYAVRTLHQRTEGWAAGLRLAVLSLAGHRDPERFVAEFSGSNRMVAEFLIAEMLERQPPEVRAMLLRTSLVDRVNGELADLLTGETGSERILLDLEDANAFVVSLDPGRTWFRYHRMFSSLLRLELRRTLPGEIPQLRRRAAHWLTEHSLSLTLDGQAETVAAIVRSLPSEAITDSPGLALPHAIVELDRLDLDRADAYLRAAYAYAATAPPGDRYRLQAGVASLDLVSARLRGRHSEVFERARAFLGPAVGRSASEIALAEDLRALALLQLGISESWSLRLADGVRHLQDGAVLARRIGRPYLEVACLAHLAFASTAHSLALARTRSQEAIALAARHGWDTDPVIAPALATLAGTLIFTGQSEPGERWLEHAEQVTGSEGELISRLLVRVASAALPTARGDHRQALEELDAAARIQRAMGGAHALSGWITASTLAARARLGMIGQARETLAGLDEERGASGPIRTAAAVVRLAEHDPVGARRELRSVLDDTAPANNDPTRVEAHLLDALAGHALGDRHAERQGIEHALRHAEPDRLIMPFTVTGAWRLLETLPPRATSHRPLVADILDTVRGRAAPEPVRSAPTRAEPLSPSELRVLRYLPTHLTRPEIAGELSVSLNTVSTHIRRIYAKLDVADRRSAVRRGRELRLISTGRA